MCGARRGEPGGGEGGEAEGGEAEGGEVVMSKWGHNRSMCMHQSFWRGNLVSRILQWS